jgi:hypothetical protein
MRLPANAENGARPRSVRTPAGVKLAKYIFHSKRERTGLRRANSLGSSIAYSTICSEGLGVTCLRARRAKSAGTEQPACCRAIAFNPSRSFREAIQLREARDRCPATRETPGLPWKCLSDLFLMSRKRLVDALCKLQLVQLFRVQSGPVWRRSVSFSKVSRAGFQPCVAHAAGGG